MRGAMFGMYTLEDIPQLNEQAATDLAGYRPTPIPTISVKGAHMALSALHTLPLPGRPRPQPQPQPQAPQMKYNHPPLQMNYQQQHPHKIYQNQNIDHQAHPIYNQYSQKQYSPSNNIYEPSVSKPIIQQVFQESEPINNYYTATTSLPDPEPAPKSSSPKFELPANLKEMLSQLKKNGFVSSDEEPSSTSAPEESITTDPLVSAMQTAQQMMQNQQLQTSTTNTYASEESSQDYPMDGYVVRPHLPLQR